LSCAHQEAGDNIDWTVKEEAQSELTVGEEVHQYNVDNSQLHEVFVVVAVDI